MQGREEEFPGGLGAEELKLRIWCTVLSLIVMENLPFGWLADPEKGDFTLVDRSARWLDEQRVTAVLPDRNASGRDGESTHSTPRRAGVQGRAAQILEFARQIVQSAAAQSDDLDLEKVRE